MNEILSLSGLLSTGIHLGCSFINFNLLSGWLVFSFSGKVCIVNLFNTIYILKLSLYTIGYLVKSCKPIWFVNLDSMKSEFIKKIAGSCGEFCCTDFWVVGFLTNYFSIVEGIFQNMGVRNNLNFNDSLIESSNLWINTSYSWPSCVILGNYYMNQAALSESDIGGIVTIGTCDGGYSSNSFTYPIPGNNEGVDTMIFFNTLYSSYILLSKFSNIILWYTTVRSGSVVNSYEELNEFRFMMNSVSYLPLNGLGSVEAFSLFYSGMSLFFFNTYNSLNKWDAFNNSGNVINESVNNVSNSLYLEIFFFENSVNSYLYSSFVNSWLFSMVLKYRINRSKFNYSLLKSVSSYGVTNETFTTTVLPMASSYMSFTLSRLYTSNNAYNLRDLVLVFLNNVPIHINYNIFNLVFIYLNNNVYMGHFHKITSYGFLNYFSIDHLSSFLLNEDLTEEYVNSFVLIFRNSELKVLSFDPWVMRFISNSVIDGSSLNYDEENLLQNYYNGSGEHNLVRSNRSNIYGIYVLGSGWASWYNCFFNMGTNVLLHNVFSIRQLLLGGVVLSSFQKNGVISGFISGFNNEEIKCYNGVSSLNSLNNHLFFSDKPSKYWIRFFFLSNVNSLDIFSTNKFSIVNNSNNG